MRDYILLFNSNYANVLEKKNIGILGAKLPDFMLLDAYSYLDIYEIKTPSTNLLKHDKSHENYYWDPEIVKAISQVENYVANADRNSNALCGEIKRHLSANFFRVSAITSRTCSSDASFPAARNRSTSPANSDGPTFFSLIVGALSAPVVKRSP